MESISPLIEPCTLHFGLLNEKEKKREKKKTHHCVFGSLCHFLFLFPALHLAAPKAMMNGAYYKGEPAGTQGPVLFLSGRLKGKAAPHSASPFPP